jgi:Uma2 family endonuclease
VLHNVNVSPHDQGWKDDFRIPDLLLLATGTKAIVRAAHIQGPPDLAVEIRSPNDEAIEKLPFYAALGVPEVWLIERDGKAFRILELRSGSYADVGPGADGWTAGPATGIHLAPGRPDRLRLRLGTDDSTIGEVPENPLEVAT